MMEEVKRMASSGAPGKELIDTSTSKTPDPHASPSKNKNKPLSEEEVKKGHCSHGPKGRCVNCLGVTKDQIKETKQPCKHGPHEKCINCVVIDD